MQNASHLLNWEEIKAKKLLKYESEDRFLWASYDLAVGNIFSIEHDKDHESLDIPPQGMALVVSKEEFALPRNIMGFTTVKNDLSMQGILAINIGIVDPGFRGPISSIIMNFGRLSFSIKKEDTFLRMTFHEFSQPRNAPKKITNKTTQFEYERRDYMKRRQQTARSQLGETYLSLEKTKAEIKKEVIDTIWEKGTKLSFLLALIIAAAAYATKVYYDKNALDRTTIKENNNSLKQQIVDELPAIVRKEIEKQKKNPK